MTCAPVCPAHIAVLPRSVVGVFTAVLHSIERDGGEGFFYASQLPTPGMPLPACTASHVHVLYHPEGVCT
jgi:hypothetical protein